MADHLADRDREELLLLYQITVGDLTYFKSQQWAVTNYAFLLLAGLAGVNQLIGSTTLTESVALAICAVAVAIVGNIVLSKLQASITLRQGRLDATRQHFGPLFSRAWAAEKKGREYLHAIWFLRAAILAGAGIVCWLVFR